MTLIITAIAAIIATVVRFVKPEIALKYRVGALALMYWGATFMWSIDGVAALSEGEAFVELVDSATVADDALLGVCVVVLGLIVWGIILLVKRNRRKSVVSAA